MFKRFSLGCVWLFTVAFYSKWNIPGWMVPRQTPRSRNTVLWLAARALCVCACVVERDGLKFGSSCGVENKVRIEQFGSLPVSSMCVLGPACISMCVCLCERAQVQLQKIVWLLFKTQYCGLASKSNPTNTFVRLQTHWPSFIIINSPSVVKAIYNFWEVTNKTVVTRGINHKFHHAKILYTGRFSGQR